LVFSGLNFPVDFSERLVIAIAWSRIATISQHPDHSDSDFVFARLSHPLSDQIEGQAGYCGGIGNSDIFYGTGDISNFSSAFDFGAGK
jgi:hypothetical protein